MASSITVEFEFEIGDLVYFKAAMHTDGETPNRFVVTERLAQQCHADIQKLYRLDGVERWIPCVALSAEMPAYQRRADDWYAERGDQISTDTAAQTKSWSMIRDAFRPTKSEGGEQAD